MKKNKVVALLTALSSKELKLFEKFVRNPHNNKKEAVVRLYEFIAKNHAAYNAQKFTKAQCFLFIYPELKTQFDKLNGKTDELVTQKLKNPLSDLKKLIEEFIVQQELAVEKHDKTLLLIKGLFKRQMREKAFQLIDKELKRLEGTVDEDFYHHFYQFRLRELKQEFTLDKVKIDSIIYSKLINNLDLFYLDSKLRFEYIVKERSAYHGDLYEYSLSKNPEYLIQNYDIKKMTPAIILYTKLFELPDDYSLESFNSVKVFYYKHVNKFNQANKNHFFIHLFNYCIDGYKNGIKDFLKEAFELKKFVLEKKINFKNGQIDTIDFTNFVVISCTLEDYDWAIHFIDQYEQFLPKDRKESIVQISKAQIEGDRPNPDFHKVIELLRDVEYFNMYDNTQARSIMMRAYYMLGEWHTLAYFLDAFYKFIDRNSSLGKEDKLSCKNMIKFTRILMNARHKKTTKLSLEEQFITLNPIRAKQWLHNRIQELFNK